MTKPRKEDEPGVVGQITLDLSTGEVTLSDMMQRYKTRIAGVTYSNEDGADRQDLIVQCKPGDEVVLVREPDNPHDSAAIAVYWKGHQIGYVPTGDRRLALHMDAGYGVFARIVGIHGGPTWLDRILGRTRSYGCVVEIAKDYKKKGERT